MLLLWGAGLCTPARSASAADQASPPPSGAGSSGSEGAASGAANDGTGNAANGASGAAGNASSGGTGAAAYTGDYDNPDTNGAGIRAGGFAPLPETPQSKIARALRKGDKAIALKMADAFLADHPRDAQVRFLRAVALQDLGRVGEAQAAFESLTQDFPELAEPYNNLAVISANQGKLAMAEHYLQLAVTAQPNYVTARENLGDLYVTLATSEYEQASRLDGANASVKRKLALARELSGKLRPAR